VLSFFFELRALCIRPVFPLRFLNILYLQKKKKVLSSPIQSSFPWKSIWKVKVLPRMSFFVWTATLRKILTLDNLRKRNIIVMEWCYMCKISGESIDHLFLHYMVAIELWRTIMQMFGVEWVMPRSVKDMLGSWWGQKGNRTLIPIWRMAPLCLM